MPHKRDPVWFYQHRSGFNEAAARLRRACLAQLEAERRMFPRLPEPEVEEAVKNIPEPDGLFNPDDPRWELAMLRHSFHWRHGMAETRCHSLPHDHAITAWFRSQPDAVILGFIRENPSWIRSAPVADRIAEWRAALIRGDKGAAARLRQLADRWKPTGRRGPRSPYPAVAAPLRGEIIASLETEARAIRHIWVDDVRANHPRGDLWLLGRELLRRLYGWRPPPDTFPPDSKQARAAVLTDPARWQEPNVITHLARRLLIIKDRDDRYDVVIDDEAWPRAQALALVAARWRVSKKWLREGRTPRSGR